MNSSRGYVQSRLRKGDIKAFEMLYNEQYKSLCYYAQRFVFDQDTSREIVQFVFVRIWEKRDSLSVDISLKTYLYAAVRNKCLDYLKHLKIENEFEKMRMKEFQESGNILSKTIDDPLDGLVTEELENAIREAIESLPDKCKAIFELSRYDGLKYSQIAEELNISVKTVETQISRAIKTLREKLSGFLVP